MAVETFSCVDTVTEHFAFKSDCESKTVARSNGRKTVLEHVLHIPEPLQSKESPCRSASIKVNIIASVSCSASAVKLRRNLSYPHCSSSSSDRTSVAPSPRTILTITRTIMTNHMMVMHCNKSKRLRKDQRMLALKETLSADGFRNGWKMFARILSLPFSDIKSPVAAEYVP